MAKPTPTPFVRTLRSANADSFGPGQLAMGASLLMMLIWTVWLIFSRVAVYEDSLKARVETHGLPHSIEPEVAGRVAFSGLVLGKTVAAGEVLVRTEDRELVLSRDESLAEQAGLKSQLGALSDELAAVEKRLGDMRGMATAVVEQQEAEAMAMLERSRLSRSEAERFGKLLDNGLATEQERERKESTARSDRWLAEASNRRKRLLALEQHATISELVAQRERLRREQASLAAAIETHQRTIERRNHQIERCAIRAPVAGTLAEVAQVPVGRYVAIGERLATVVPTGDLRVVAEFAPATALGRVRPGQRARLDLTGYPALEYGSVAAKVTSVASEVRNQTLRAELTIDKAASPVPLEHGLYGIVHVEVEQISPFQLLLRRFDRANRPAVSVEHEPQPKGSALVPAEKP